MSDDEKEGPKSSVSERNWILWMTGVVLAAIIIFELIEFWGPREEAMAPAPVKTAAPTPIPSMAPAIPEGTVAPTLPAAAPAESVKAP